MEYEGSEVNYMAGVPTSVHCQNVSGSGGHRGEFIAGSNHRHEEWGIKEKWSAWGGALSTAGDVVFTALWMDGSGC
jgi:hypothetical protein